SVRQRSQLPARGLPQGTRASLRWRAARGAVRDPRVAEVRLVGPLGAPIGVRRRTDASRCRATALIDCVSTPGKRPPVTIRQEPSAGPNAALARATPEPVVTPPDILD